MKPGVREVIEQRAVGVEARASRREGDEILRAPGRVWIAPIAAE